MLSLGEKKHGLLFAIFILLAAFMLILSQPAVADANNERFSFPVMDSGDGKLSGSLSIAETIPGSLKAGQEIKFTFANPGLNGVVWDIYHGEEPEGAAGAWIYAPPAVDGYINTIKGLTVVSQMHDSVTIRIDSLQPGDRGYLGICINSDMGGEGPRTIRPGSVKLAISSSSGTGFMESEAVNAENNAPAPAVPVTGAVPETSLAVPGAASVSMEAYGSTGLLPWPQLSYDNSRTGISPYASSPSFVKWAVKLDDLEGGTYDCTFREAPIIGKDNVVFITANSWTTDEFSVYAIYPDGTLKWKSVLSVEGDYNNYSCLTLSDDGYLYIGTNGEGKLYCLEEETGSVYWVYQAPSGPPGDRYPDSYIWAPPIIHPATGDIIFSNWALICVDRNGNEKWVYYDEAFIGEHFAAISLYNGLIYFCDWGLPGDNCRIQAVDIDGNKRYSYTFSDNQSGRCPCVGDRSAPIVLSNGNVLITGEDDVCACLTPELEPVWITDFYSAGSWLTSITPPALSPDESILYIQSWGSKVSAVETTTGNILWDIDFTQAINERLGVAYSYCQESGLAVEAGGKVLVNAYVWRPSEVNEQVLFTMDSNGEIVDAVLINTLEGIMSLTQPSIAPDGTVYLGDWYSGYVVAVGSKSGIDKSILGKRLYCFYGNGSVNLSTGNYIQEETDISVPSIGPSLEFTRFYNSTDTYTGPLGKGWTHNYNTRLVVNSDQSISVAYADGHVLSFAHNGSSYDRPAGCFETLEAGPGNTYVLTFKDQTKYAYNTAGRLTGITDKNGNTLTLAYTDGLLASATEPAGRSLTFSYNTDGLISGIVDSAGRSVSYAYDNGNLAAVQDVRGGITSYNYSTLGLIEIIDQDGVKILGNEYDSCSRVTGQTDGRGNQTGFSYDPVNRRTTVTDALGHVTTADYDEKHRGTGITYPGNITETSAYNENHCRTGITDARGYTTNFNYDGLGNILDVTDPADNTTVMTYDGCNNLLTVTNAASKQVTFTYDAGGNLKTIMDPFGNITAYDYYSSGLLQSETTPAGGPGSGTTTYTYQDGLLQTVTDPAGITTTFGYDPAGWPNTVTDNDGRITAMNYDEAGNLLDITDPLGNKTSFSYDWRGGILTRTDARGYLTQYFYNGVGLLERKLDALNNETLYDYNALNQLEKITDPRGYSTTYSYDALGRLNGITDPLGCTFGFQYDAAGNLAGQTDALNKQVLTVGYDSRNNPETVRDALGNSIIFEYDSLSRLTNMTDPMNYMTSFDYDDLNRLKSTTDSLSGRGSQEFDEHGNRKAMVDPNTNRTSYDYDTADRLTGRANASGLATLNLEYNSRNLVSSKTNARGQTTYYEYDDAGRLRSFTSPDGTVSFTCDPNGNLLTAADGAGTIVCEYDALNRIKRYTDTQGNIIGYDYDASSNLSTLTYPGGKQVTYEYDPANRLVKVTDWAGRITSYDYDPNGGLTKTTHPNGAVTSRSYEDAGRLKQLKVVDSSGNMISRYDYTYDASGNITEELNSNGNVPFTMNDAALAYGPDNRLAAYNGQDAVYDADGNMTSGPLAGNMVDFTYDARGRLTGAGNTSYTYDAGNNRIRASDGAHQTSYAVNPNTPLSQVLVQTDEQNNQTFYVYGPGLIGQETGGAYRSYHYDSRGSTVALTNESGQVTDRFLYAPYGELVYRSGNTITPFLFNGQYGVMTDAGDLYYMRARYYNPVAKRFLSPDTLTGQITNPQSQNLYTYCEGNPVIYVDPTGHFEATTGEGYNPDYDWFNFINAWEFFKPNEIDIAWFQAGGPSAPETGAAGYVIGRIAGKETAEKLLGKVLTGTEKNVLKLETHHLLPKQFRDKFEKVGLNIDDYTIDMLQDAHRLKPDGIHTGTENWNKQWEEFFDEHPEAKKEQILDYLEVLKKKYGIE